MRAAPVQSALTHKYDKLKYEDSIAKPLPSILHWKHWSISLPNSEDKLLVASISKVLIVKLYKHDSWFDGLQAYSFEEYPYWTKCPKLDFSTSYPPK